MTRFCRLVEILQKCFFVDMILVIVILIVVYLRHLDNRRMIPMTLLYHLIVYRSICFGCGDMRKVIFFIH